MMFLQVIILLAGFLFLVKGADWFVEQRIKEFSKA